MAVNSVHPDYAANADNWELMKDSYEGEKAVKAKGQIYLPATPGMRLDGMENKGDGAAAYEDYKLRAVFPDYVSDGVEMYIGLLHQKPATITLPAAMEPLLLRATSEGESLQALLRRINESQLVTGRLGLLLDFPSAPPDVSKALPYIALYTGLAIRNWDESDDGIGVNKLNLVVLDESAPVRQADFEWVQRERYRVLVLRGPEPAATNNEQGSTTKPDDVTELPGRVSYFQDLYEIQGGNGLSNPTSSIEPMYKGTPLEEIPFVFVNSKDTLTAPDDPPLLGLARLCMTIYRGEADYRQTLWLQSQDTLVIIGGTARGEEDKPTRVGAGAKIECDLTGDAKFIGVSADGLSEQRSAIENDRKLAEARSGTMISPSAGKQESGDALTTRLSAQTASLTQIAQTGAGAVEQLLKIAARWMGLNEDEVSVKANTEFTPILLSGQEVSQLMAARMLGAPISLESIHAVLKDRGLAKFDYEEEMDLISEEDADRAARVAKLPQPPAPPRNGGDNE